jgi:hypothetical protein
MRTPGGTLWTGWGYAKILLVVVENKKKGVKIKKRKLLSFGLQKDSYVKVVTRPSHHWSYDYFNVLFICFDLVLGCYYNKLK